MKNQPKKSRYLANLKASIPNRTNNIKPKIRKRLANIASIAKTKVVKNPPVEINQVPPLSPAFHISMATRAKSQGKPFYLVGKSNACPSCGGVKFSSQSCKCLSC